MVIYRLFPPKYYFWGYLMRPTINFIFHSKFNLPIFFLIMTKIFCWCINVVNYKKQRYVNNKHLIFSFHVVISRWCISKVTKVPKWNLVLLQFEYEFSRLRDTLLTYLFKVVFQLFLPQTIEAKQGDHL